MGGLLDALAGLGTTTAHRHLVEVAEVVQLLLVVVAAADQLNDSLLAVNVERRRQGLVEHVAEPMEDHVDAEHGKGSRDRHGESSAVGLRGVCRSCLSSAAWTLTRKQ